MIKKLSLPFMLAIVVILFFTQCSSNNENKNKKTTMSDRSVSAENNKVRLSLISIDPEQLDEYNVFLKEEIETSMKLESGVLTLYAVSDKENPNKVVILEIYADEEAYQKHIKTPHFIKYKEGTLDMVQSLELIDTTPLIPWLEIKNKSQTIKNSKE